MSVEVYVECYTPNRQTTVEVERALKLLKKRMEEAGIFKEMRKRRYHRTKSDIKAEKKVNRRKAIAKMQKREQKANELER